MEPTSDPTNPTTTTETPTDAAPRGPLTNAELQADHPAVAVLVKELETIGKGAVYLGDPRQGVEQIVTALVTYFRTPDAP